MNVCHAIYQAVINEIRKRTVVSIGSGLVYDSTLMETVGLTQDTVQSIANIAKSTTLYN